MDRIYFFWMNIYMEKDPQVAEKNNNAKEGRVEA